MSHIETNLPVGRFTSKAVANWLLDRFGKDGRPCTQLQLNKLVYIFHGWHLAVAPHGDGLIAEPVVAWKYGPVIPSLRSEFKEFGADPITRRATELIGAYEEYVPTLSDFQPTKWEWELLNWAYNGYGRLTSWQLIQLTHQSDSPWSIVTVGGTDVGHNKVIPNDLIRKHYRDLLQKSRTDASGSRH